MSDRWYYRLLGEEFGPVSTSDLSDLMSVGTLGESDEVREEQSAAWQPISVALEAVNASAASGGDTALGGLNIDDFVFESSESDQDQASSDDDPQRIMDLDDLSFEFGDSGEAEKPAPPRRAPIPAPPVYQPLPELSTDADVAEPAEQPRAKPSPAVERKSNADDSAPRRASASAAKPKRERPGRNNATRKRRPKKKPKVDEELEGIFDEVFSGEEAEADSAAPAASSAPAAPASREFTPAPAPAPAPAPPMAPPPPVRPPAAVRPSPIKPPKIKKTSGSSGSGENSKKLAMGGGALVVLVALCWWLGLFGGGGGPAVDHTPAVKQLMTHFDKLSEYSRDDPNWEDFTKGAREEVPALTGAIRDDENTDEKSMKALLIAKTMMRLVGAAKGDQETRDRFAETVKTEYESYQKMD